MTNDERRTAIDDVLVVWCWPGTGGDMKMDVVCVTLGRCYRPVAAVNNGALRNTEVPAAWSSKCHDGAEATTTTTMNKHCRHEWSIAVASIKSRQANYQHSPSFLVPRPPIGRRLEETMKRNKLGNLLLIILATHREKERKRRNTMKNNIKRS